MDRGISAVMFLAIVGVALLFFAYFFEKWFDKQLIERSKRLKRLKKERQRRLKHAN